MHVWCDKGPLYESRVVYFHILRVPKQFGCWESMSRTVSGCAERGCAAAAGAQEPERVRLDSVHAATARGAGADAAPIPQADAGAGFVARAGDGGAVLAAPRRPDPNPSNGGYGNGAAAGPMPLLEGDAADEVEHEIGPVLPEGLGSGLGEEDEEDDPWRLPITHEVAFEGACCESRAIAHAFVTFASTVSSTKPPGCTRPQQIHNKWHLICRTITVQEPGLVCPIM